MYCPNRLAGLTGLDPVKAQIDYKRRPHIYRGWPAVVVDIIRSTGSSTSRLQTWRGVTDITYIRTYEGFAYLTVVIDLYSRQVIGWQSSASPLPP